MTTNIYMSLIPQTIAGLLLIWAGTVTLSGFHNLGRVLAIVGLIVAYFR